MAKIVWSQDKDFEFGVDQVVFYPEEGPAVPWNGVKNITETYSNESVTPQYFDGVKYFDTVGASSLELTVTSITEPLSFNYALGLVDVVPGFFLTHQPKTYFGLSYRTKIGENLGFKLHMVYNIMAKSSNVSQSTITASVDPQIKSWTLTPIPLDISGFVPSAHFVADSRKITPELFSNLQNVLYGDSENNPRLPTISELVDWSLT